MHEQAPVVMAYAFNDWDGPWMNRQQLLSRLACRGIGVLYSTGLWMVWNRHRLEWRTAPALGGWLEHDGVLIDRPPKWALRWPGHGVVDAAALAIGGARWRRRIRRLRPGTIIAYVFHPDFLPCARSIRPDVLVYHQFDLLLGQTSTRQQRLLREILGLADLVIASSEPIAREQRGLSARSDVRVLPNGADAAAFSRGEQEAEPADLGAIPVPRIVYAGNLNRKVDWHLIATLAQRRPDWHFVLIGAVGKLDDAVADANDVCRNLANVHFLGPKHHSELPAYVGHADVNIMAYRRGEGLWSDGGYPLKLHEYLAAGKPVVSTPLETVRPFDHVLALAEGPQQWEFELERAINQGGEGTTDERQCVAAANSWDARVDVLERWLRELPAVGSGSATATGNGPSDMPADGAAASGGGRTPEQGGAR